MNEIIIHPDDCRTVTGELAHNLAFSGDWRKLLVEHPMQDGAFYVFEPQPGGQSPILRAAQSTKEGALEYLAPDRVLVYYA